MLAIRDNQSMILAWDQKLTGSLASLVSYLSLHDSRLFFFGFGPFSESMGFGVFSGVKNKGT